MDVARGLLVTLQRMVEGVIAGKSFTKVVTAELVSVSPITFSLLSGKIRLKGANLVIPAHRVFTAEEIGRSFCFLENEGGQQYYYLYEAAPSGENGKYLEYEIETGSAHAPGYIRKKERLIL